ncbi:phosphoglucosamine mutase [Candidatus Micrarchaeota archaeon]|nr:phosphoglucosamine mutase [Candidatus Micrarchaeota archaeon]
MFGTSGVRGIVNEEISCKLAMQIGNAAGVMANAQNRGKGDGGLTGGKGKNNAAAHAQGMAGGNDGEAQGGNSGNARAKIIVARDCRTSGPMLSFSFMAGAMQAGADVIDIGIVPTPALSFACMREKCIGAMITASHNPPQYNGIKLFFEGREFSLEWEKEIEGKVKEGMETVSWGSAGQFSKNHGALEAYKKFILSLVDVALIKKRKPRVAVDCGNAAASVLMPALLREAGCEVEGLFCEPSGMPKRGLEPSKENLAELCALVEKEKADIGIAHDGDADRAVMVDEGGKMLGLDAQLGVMVRYLLQKKKGVIVSTVESSLSLREIVRHEGGTLEITPVGSLHVAQKVREKNAVFGGEPCGEYVFADALPCPDGPLAALFFLQILAEKGSLAKLAGEVKTYPIAREKFACANGKKKAALEKIKKALSKIEGSRNEMDGLRIDFKEGWLLVRPSGTEPFMRLTCECKTQKKLGEICKIAREEIENAVA